MKAFLQFIVSIDLSGITALLAEALDMRSYDTKQFLRKLRSRPEKFLQYYNHAKREETIPASSLLFSKASVIEFLRYSLSELPGISPCRVSGEHRHF